MNQTMALQIQMRTNHYSEGALANQDLILALSNDMTFCHGQNIGGNGLFTIELFARKIRFEK